MKELTPKFKVDDIVRAEWDGCRSAFVKIESVVAYSVFIGYNTESGQHFLEEEELSSDIRVGDIVKSVFNGFVSLVTKTGMENANVVEVQVANNGSFRLLTDSEIEHLSTVDMMSFVRKDKYPDIIYDAGDYVVARGIRFKGIQPIIEKYATGTKYLISDNGCKIWCNKVDIKKWIPKQGDNVITDVIRFYYDEIDETFYPQSYTIISSVMEVREKSNSVILADGSSHNIKDIKPYKENITIDHKKAKERLTIVAVSLMIYIVFVDPLVRWFNLEDSNVLSDWYFAIVLPIVNLIFYGLLFLIVYCIVVGFMWIFGIEDKE